MAKPDKVFEHCCPWWLAYTFDHPLRRLFQQPEKILAPYLGPGMTALDLGCGMGFFSIAMAGMVGPEGRVIAVDLQPQMHRVLQKRAARKKLAQRINCVLAREDDIMVREPVDFILAMWMVHEVRDQARLFEQAIACMKDSSRFLIAEPRMHVKKKQFEAMLELAGRHGLTVAERARAGLSRAAALKKNARPPSQ